MIFSSATYVRVTAQSPPNKGLQLPPASLGIRGSGSLLAFSFSSFGEAGQRWLVQLKPDPLAGAKRARSLELIQRMRAPEGTRIILGVPAKPMPSEISAAITAVVESTPGITEAHLPLFEAPGVLDQPAQVLVFATSPGVSVEAVLSALEASLASALPPGHHIDVWPESSDSEMLNAVRDVGCEIFRVSPVASSEPRKRPWWRFWGAG